MPRRTVVIVVGGAVAAVTAVALSFLPLWKPVVIAAAAVVGIAGALVSERKEKERNVNAYVKSGNTKYRLGDYQGSIEDFDKALVMDSQYALAYYNRGNAKDELEDYEGAISDYTMLLLIIIEALQSGK